MRGGAQRAGVWLLAGVLSLASPQWARACEFHGYTPDPTLVDFLLNTEQVVLAQLAPDSRDHYLPVAALLGPELETLPGVAVDLAIKARLAEDPSQTVLLARDGAYGPWQAVAVLDENYQQIVEHVLANQAGWLFANQEDRLNYFAAHVNDPNPDIRRLALRELDRAPYSALRATPLPQVFGLREDLTDGEAGLRPIRLLLAGLSEDEGFLPILKAGFADALEAETPHLGAYAVAMIELEGPPAVTRLVDEHLRTGAPSAVNQQRILQAIAIQYRAAPPQTRRHIAAEMARLMRSAPALRASVAEEFAFLDRRQQTP